MSSAADALPAAVSESAWNEMLDEFRALGGTADNVCMRIGPLGRGIFPRDPSRPVSLRIPRNLLLPADDFILEDGAVRLRQQSAAGARERAFLERYENEFSWGAGGRAEVEAFLEGVRAFPEQLKEIIGEQLGYQEWFEEDSPELLLKRFLEGRVLDYEGRPVVIPIIELVNHGHKANYREDRGVTLGGVFSGEVLVTYTIFDPIQMFLKYGFASQEPVAFSARLTLKKPGRTVGISRDLEHRAKTIDDWIWIPQLTSDQEQVSLSFLMIGSKRTPRIPRGIFHRLMRGVLHAETEETFEVIQHLNGMFFLKLLELLDGCAGDVSHALRRAVRFQLEAMSHSYGVREP